MKSNRKWGIAGSVAVVLALAGWLGYTSFQDALVYFYTPSEVVKLGSDFEGKRIRVGGMVEAGSMKMTAGTMKIDFRLSDGETVIPVHFEGVPPDLFKDGQGAVAEGVWMPADKAFRADLIMAKHSEDYMPIEMKREGKAMPKEDLLKTLKQ
ncbi:MAG: cytochrome c maturation protein CcmE [Sulfuricellaceae bacterium]|nr:cytochrome c maturation protein CcmE [Sulfuricellaceae bacterium]